ncbi:hypothetical protein V500_08398, partial [Pseudogymnoascus sp. VKM F-4518 (FW-2643)]
MEIDTTSSAAPKSPILERSQTLPARQPPPSDRPAVAKRVSFDVPERAEDPKRLRPSPPPSVQPTTTSPATPAP